MYATGPFRRFNDFLISPLSRVNPQRFACLLQSSARKIKEKFTQKKKVVVEKSFFFSFLALEINPWNIIFQSFSFAVALRLSHCRSHTSRLIPRHHNALFSEARKELFALMEKLMINLLSGIIERWCQLPWDVIAIWIISLRRFWSVFETSHN